MASEAEREAAFNEARSALSAEINTKVGDGCVAAVLVSPDFERFEEQLANHLFFSDAEDDAPVPLPSLNLLRDQVRYIILPKEQWEARTDYGEKTCRIFDTHEGGGTSMADKLHRLYQKGITTINSKLRAASYSHAFCEAVELTRCMKIHDDFYADTDAPEAVERILGGLGRAWSQLLARPEYAEMSGLQEWLALCRAEWEGEAAEHLGHKLTFAFEAKPIRTPTKAPKAEAVAKSGVKRRRAAEAQGPDCGGPAAKRRAAKAPACSPGTLAWLHRFDGELKQRQASAVQLRCEVVEDGVPSGVFRTMVVTGAYPLRAVGATLAEAFGHAAGEFSPHPNKTPTPPGLRFALIREGREEGIKSDLKVVQAVQEVGDEMVVVMEGLHLSVKLDYVLLKTDELFTERGRAYLPRCVGGDAKLTQPKLKRLNKIFLANRQPTQFLGCSRGEQIEATLKDMACPLNERSRSEQLQERLQERMQERYGP